ncbi:NUDIX hydrolase [Pseudonocardia sp. HH130630-07]|uniref:NUDIX hydrolase n=1 Tax=Pseudonocardia sp. HH130630-07 TaxID=1690815 RepID=UPI000815077B|nr:CoA pyrophosphatase [Pseudonocardia sp. HH130630-07]ANY06888.1 coenzyme A pyrophosphatase [Pseudonocardia sp. HH130630-07]
MTGRAVPEPDPGAAPPSLVPLVEGVRGLDAAWFGSRRDPAAGRGDGRRAAVLMLFADGDRGPDVLLTERAATLRSHAGQVAFPGGRVDPGDTGPVDAAVREAREETGLDPAGVVPLCLLPELLVPPTGALVTPVLAHWARPVPVDVVDPAEVARVLRVPVAELADPANRISVRGPRGYVGPAFRTSGLLVWGFTGGLLSALLRRAGWERPWDEERVEGLDEAWAASARPGHGEPCPDELRGERVTDPVDRRDEVGR